MECVEMALIRKGFRSGLMGMGCGLKQAPLPVVLVEDSWAANAGESGGSGNGYGDDSFVDELLNLNNDNTEDGLACVEETDEKDDEKASAFPSPPLTTIEPKTENIYNKDSLKDDDFGSVLIVPADEPDLDWLSQFVEDSFSEFSTPFPVNFPLKPGSGARTSAPTMATPGLMKSKRSKRARAGGRNWSFGSSPVLTDSTTTSSSSSTSSSPPSLSSTRITFIPISPSQQADGAKKQRMRRATEETGGVSDAGGSQQAPRRCSHCGVQKTPQWRTGPNGAKTLCNACGVRYKSGRLLPEYRPACSPTFSSEMHSNNHRKVLEMRRKKQDLMLMMAVTGRSPPPPSFV